MRLTALIALLLFQLTTRAQSENSSVINVAGNSYSSGTLEIDWSLGELALVNTQTSSDGKYVITNGLLQPGILKTNNANNFTADEIKIAPNLTHGLIEVHFLTRQQGTVKMSVYDAKGKLLRFSKAFSNGAGSIAKINLSSFAAGTYFLQLDLEPALGSVRKSGSYKIVRL
jgi:hypothetical protein